MTGAVQNVTFAAVVDKRALGRMRIALLVFFHMTAIAAGIQSALIHQNTLSIVLTTFLTSVAAGGWCQLDASLRGNILPLKWLMLWLAPISTGMYLVWTRGLYGLGWGLANLLGFYFLSTVAMMVTRLIFFGLP